MNCITSAISTISPVIATALPAAGTGALIGAGTAGAVHILSMAIFGRYAPLSLMGSFFGGIFFGPLGCICGSLLGIGNADQKEDSPYFIDNIAWGAAIGGLIGLISSVALQIIL